MHLGLAFILLFAYYLELPINYVYLLKINQVETRVKPNINTNNSQQNHLEEDIHANY